MAQSYDGDIQLSVGLSLEDAKDQATKITEEISKMFDSVDSSNLDKNMRKLETTMSKVETQMESTMLSIQALEEKAADSNAYVVLVNNIDAAKDELKQLTSALHEAQEAGDAEGIAHFTELVNESREGIRLAEEEMERLEAIGHTTFSQEDAARLNDYKNKLSDLNNTQRLNMEAFNQMRENGKYCFDGIRESARQLDPQIAQTIKEYESLGQQIRDIKSWMKQLEDAGAGIGHVQYDALVQELARLEERYASCGEKVEAFRAKLQGAHAEASTSHSRFSVLGKAVLGVIKAFGAAGSNMTSFISHMKKGSSSAVGFGNTLNKIIPKILKFGTALFGISKIIGFMKNSITSGIETIALMNGGVNQTNAAMSQLLSMLNLVKGSLATAFAPIITAAVPMLTSLMQTLADAITYVSMFIAKLTGAKSYMKAVKKNTNYAATTSGGKAAQKAADKQAAAVDKAQDKYDKAVAKAQQKYEDQLSKVRQKNSKAEAKAEEKQAKAADKLAKAQKRANSELSSLDKLNVINTQDLEELEEIQADVYEEPELNLPSLEDYMDAIADSLGGGGGSESPFDMIEVPLDNIEWQWDWDEIKNQAEKFGRDLADKLNSFFEDENFAKDLGHNIAEALNTALSFAYGFVTQFDWKQFGHWLGTLIQEGLETFEWDKLGKVIGELVNGLVDTIKGMFERYKPGTIGASIGTLLTNAVKTVKWGNLGEVLGTLLNEFALSVIRFFQEYPVGTIGASLAEMLNNAIKTVNPENLGVALSDILKAPFIELSNFFTETNWTALGDKLSRFISNAFSSKSLNNQTLGETIGTTLGNLINAGSQFLLGFDTATVVANLVTFFTEAITTALFTIKWEDLFQAVWKTIIGILTGLIQGVIETILDVILKIAQAVMDGIIDYLEQKYPLLTGELEKVRGTIHDNYAQMKEDMHEQLTEATRETVNFFTGTSTSAANSAQAVEASSKRFNSAIADMIDYMTDWSSGAAVDWDAALQGIQREFEFTDEDMDTLIGTFGSMDEKFNDSDEILTGYTGSWEEYKKTISDTSSQVKTDVSTSTKEVTKSVEGMGKDVTDSIGKTAKDSGEGFKKITESAEKNLKKDKFTKIGQNNIIKGLASAIRQTGPATSAANLASNTITNTFRTRLAATVLSPVGVNLIAGLVNGMMSRLRSALDSIRSICNQITSTVKAAFGQHSPSKVFAEIGKNLMLGLEGGVEDNADGVTDSFEDLVPSNDMLSEFADKYLATMENLTASVSDMFDGMSEHISGSLDGLGSLQKFKNFKGNMSISSMAVPGIAQGFKLPSSLELKTNGDSLSTQLPGMLKSAMLEALQEGYTSDLTEKSIIINIDGKNVFEAVRNQDTKYKKQHGASAFG